MNFNDDFENMSSRELAGCAHIAHATVGGNSPKGLRGCMRRSKKAAPRQAKRGAFRRFNWRKGAVERKE